MMGFNHAIVGGLIGYYLPLPVAVPAAIASHFILDTLPHYGLPHKVRDYSRLWKTFFICDTFVTAALIAIPVARHHYAMLLCGFLAVLPDFVWVAQVIKSKSFELSINRNWYTKFHAGIQRYERPWGIWIELPLAALAFVWLWNIR